MNRHAIRAAALVSGALFSVGLMLSGMTLPVKVLGFLDVFGDWDPTLAFVMGGAVTAHAALRPLVMSRPTPVFAPAFSLPAARDIDARLIAGAVMFGVGWGMVGLCPGPAMVNLAGGLPAVWLFVAAMIGGMSLYRLTSRG